MKKHLWAFAALTWATFAWGDVPLGDIYSLTPVEGSGDTALVAGEKIQFKIRLLAKNLTDSGALASEWSIVHTAIGSKEIDDLNSPLMIGIIVSGRLRGAKILSATPCAPIEPGGGDKSYPYTDLLCEYQVQPGDIARPVYLALEGSTDDNPIIPGSAGQPETRYYIWNSSKWAVRDTTGNVCTFSFCGDDRGIAAKSSFWGKQSDIGDYPTPDYDLSKANFNIQSVNFDENKDSENYWREVKQGTTETMYRPMIQTIGKPETSIRLYVWSENEHVVVPFGANVTERTVTLFDGSTRKIQMAEIKVITGETDYPFQIKGVTEGESTNLILSPTPGYRFNNVGETITNFVTAAVYCTEPPKPNLQVCFDPANPTSSKTLTVDTSMKQVENLADDAKPLYIVLSEKYESDVTVSLELTNVAKPECNPITNLNLAVEQYGDSFSTMPADRAYTNVTIKAGDTIAQVYLYPLGGTADTQSQGINIQPKILTEGAAGHFEVGQRALLKIRGSHKPTIVTPEAGTNYDAQEPTGFTVPVGVADCYRDLNLSQGFKVDVDYSDGGKMATTNVVFTENGEVPITLSGYGINVTYANIKVTEPDGTAYATVKVYFTVKPQKTVTAALYDSTAAKEPHEGTTFKEGDTPIVRFTISEKKPAGELNNLYAFLVPQNEASSNLVDCSAFTEGVLIPGGQTESALSAYWKLELKDGTALTDGSKGQLSYKIMLRTSPEITGGVLEESYIDVDGLQFTVENIDSTLEGVAVNGDPTPVVRDSVYEQTVAADTEVSFVVSMTDPSIVDQTNGLISIWMFTSGRSRISYNYSCVTSTTETAEMLHRFADPGTTQQVQVVAVDKDLLKSLSVESIKNESDLKTLWPRLQKALSEESFYKFKVAVDQAPMIILLPEELSFDEKISQAELNNRLITVELNNPAPADLKVRLSIRPLADENPGSLKFETTAAKPDPENPGGSYVDLIISRDQVVPTTQKNSFYKGGVKLTSTGLDGSAGSTDQGWSLEARVIQGASEGEYSDGYGMIYIQNMPPEISPKQSDPVTTNKQLSVGESWKFAWSVNDIQADFDYEWPNGQKGIKCDWYVNDGLIAGKTTYVSSKESQETEIQINQEGLTVVKLVATDKDGEDYNGVAERVWYFYIAPTKRLAVTPVGPASNSKTKYFKRASGLGQGRTWTTGTGLTLAGFQQTWNFNISSPSAEVRAYGYASAPAPYVDDGHLGPAARDVPISPTGEAATSAPYYEYDGVYDNYFYCWAFITESENGAGSEITYSILEPTFSPLAETMEPVKLDEYDEKKEAYETKRVEAIFSREYLTSDNLGDINQDAIPDYYLTRYPDFGIADEEGKVTGDDLKNLAKFNEDGDYLPNTMDAPYAAFIPQLSNTWATAGKAFTARLEVRGWGEGLNDAPALAGIKGAKPDRIYTDPQSDTNSTLAYVEYVAFTNWCVRTEAGDPTSPALWQKWSPERPTDPTLADTDDDGLPDGYEYYIWYKAHVGELVVKTEEKKKDDKKITVVTTNLVRYTGRKYNISDPVHPIKISADEIEKLYDPITPNDELAEADTDFDGLPDLVEFEIGTNPFDYDTDGDGLPDGWEVAYSKTDPLNKTTNGLSDNLANPDGDVMAFGQMPFYPVTVWETNEVNGVIVTTTNTYYTVGLYTNDAPVDVFTAFAYDKGGKGEDILAIGAWVAHKSDPSSLFKVIPPDRTIEKAGKPTSIIVLHDAFLNYGLQPFNPKQGWDIHHIGGDTVSLQYSNYDEFMLLAYYLQSGQATLKSLDIDEGPHFGSQKLIDAWALSTTNPLSADTDADGMPDGWELYVASGCGPQGPWSPIYDFSHVADQKLRDPDDDGLDFVAEFCGVECCEAYEKCETIVNIQPEWRNKHWPTDPFNGDTDGDGLLDGEEHTWLFGDDGMNGGGLNPLSWDTDGDGLPDPWELEFCGTFTDSETSTEVVESTSGEGTNAVKTVTTNTVTKAGAFQGNGMNPTLIDANADYDGDGLYNWQEYMVGAMRCWRYDDVTSPWVSLTGLEDGDLRGLFNPSGLTAEDYRPLLHFLKGYWTLGKDMEAAPVTPESLGAHFDDQKKFAFNPGFRDGYVDPGLYFSWCTNKWDSAYGRPYMFKDGIYHDLKLDYIQPFLEYKDPTKYNRWTWVWLNKCAEPPFKTSRGTEVLYPTKYITCDPREADTDGDGMDDFYEIFHGLNPLLGLAESKGDDGLPKDIVFMAWGGKIGETISAKSNYYIYYNPEMMMWIYHFTRDDAATKPYVKDEATSNLDFYQFPWLAGLATADPDGDNIRNQQESILTMAQASPTYQHTDPTPLWMTDDSFEGSLTKRFYNASDSDDPVHHPIPPIPYEGAGMDDVAPAQYNESAPPAKGGWFVQDGVVYHLTDFPWISYDSNTGLIHVNYKMNIFNSTYNLYSYEQNEGYDSDHDYLSDFEESQGRTKSPSDPQQHDDPIRHQAMYFDGVDSFLQGMMESAYPLPSDAAASESRQDFLYFTVEAWVKVDQSNIDDGQLHTVVERAIRTGESNPGDETFLRKNFLIGVKNGLWYGKFDSTGTDKGQAVEITDGPKATTNWTHIALTYGPKNDDEQDVKDPMALKLYVHDTNGDLVRMSTKRTAVQPEHGDAMIALDPDTLVGMSVPVLYAPYITIVVGTSVTADKGALTAGIDITDFMSTFYGCYGNWFKGYVDEVRIWDGARSEAEINDLLKVRMTSQLAQENRAQVYMAWAEGARRAPGTSKLPAELRHHWSFDHLPSAVEAKDVIREPAGFNTKTTATDAKPMWSRPEGYVCGWWSMVNVASKVYTNRAWVPWINNTVSHLPCLDGTTLDSFYWSEGFAGDHPATEFNIGSFAFPRTAEVWSYITMQSTPDGIMVPTWWNRAPDQEKARFNLRNRVTQGADLLPMGGAYAKRISAAEGGMWDDAGASDAWAETGVDADNNALPDWWEKYALKNYSPDVPKGGKMDYMTSVNYHGIQMTAMEAYLFDLANGLLPDGKIHSEYADTRDMDQDGIPDWWEDMYGIQTNNKSDADADPDNDGLSNYQEYLLSVVYPRDYADEFEKYGIQAPHLNPTLARSSMEKDVNQLVPDYFLRYSPTNSASVKNAEGKDVFELNQYFGEIVADDDYMENWWENAVGSSFANAAKYDPLNDKDEDGWSNWAECRAALWGGYFNASLIDQWTGAESDQHVVCYPEPILGVKVTYHGVQDIRGQQLVIRATTGQTPRTDAVFVIPGTLDSQTRYIGGFNADRYLHGHLSPGYINANTIMFECARVSSEKTYTWNYNAYPTNEVGIADLPVSGTFDEYRYWYTLYPKIELEGADLTWENFVTTIPSTDLGVAQLLVEGGVQFGSVNCLTGEYELDMSKFPLEGGPKQYVYRVTYSSRVGNEWPQTVYVSDTKELASGAGSGAAEGSALTGRGHLREGKNTVEVFFDLNGDGLPSAGEPYGSMRNVQVGWHKVPTITIELKDESPIMAPVTIAGDGEGLTKMVRIVREGINEVPAPRALATKTIVPSDRPYLSEVDACSALKPDLDWVWLTKDAARLGVMTINNATYSVYEVDPTTTSNTAILAQFTKAFPSVRPTATAVAPKDGAPVYTASPTFDFSVSDPKATAYRLQIRRPGDTDMIYDSGLAFLPGRVGTTVGANACEVTAPIYAGAPVYTGITTNHLVFADYTNYQWRVALYDAKYNATTDDSDLSSEWSAWANFEMDIHNRHRYAKIPTECGNAAIAVRYFGPLAMNPTNIIVEAFENADFRGQPIAQVRLSDIGVLARTDDISTPNAVLYGIRVGTTFFRAFYDQNDNGVRDRWETWGYVNEVAQGLRAVYNPHALTITASFAEWGENAKAQAVIYMTDCDVNQNEHPDCLEPEKFPPDAEAVEGDGSLDWWEWAESDPTDVADGSVMAYYQTELYGIVITDGVRDYTYLLMEGEDVPRAGNSAERLKLATYYDYQDGVFGYGLPVETNKLAGCIVKEVNHDKMKVAFVHAQVREKFGFSTETAIPGGKENTKAFTAQDKYLVLRYLENTGRISEDLIAIATNANKTTFEAYVYESGNEALFEAYTLKPALTDTDYDGIPDGWELYVDSNPLNWADREDDWDKDGLKLWQEYDESVARDTVRPTDPYEMDTDGDGVLDKYAYMYHLKGGDSGLDFDGDGLSNYAEYLITEVFKYAKCDPDNDRTNGHCVDAFLKVGSIYLGEIFKDHDQIDDAWEDRFETTVPNHPDRFYASRYVYDAWEDFDEDGWSNYAEYRAGTDPSSSTALSIDGYTCPEYPMPAIEANVIYNGSDVITGPLVFKAWSEVDDYDMVKAPDAMWTLGTALQSTTKEGASSGSETVQGSALQQHEKFIGRKPQGERTFYLTGGNISEGTVKLLFLDKGYGIVTYDPLTNLYYPYAVGEPDKALWYYVIIDKGGKLVRTGSSLYKAMGYEEVVVGTVDYKTGRVTINFDHPELCGAMAGDPNEGQSGSSENKDANNGNDTENSKYHWLDLDESYVRIEWKATQAAMAATGLHYFCDPDPVSADHKTLGHLREGKHSFVCFVDDDGNGEYTPGELFGFVRGVDVGWSNAKFTIELTETHPIFGRVGFDGNNDRAVWYGNDSGNVTDMTYSVSSDTADVTDGAPVDSSLSGGKLQRVRIDRYAVNGARIGYGVGEVSVPNRVLVDKVINLNRPYLHEGDFMNGDEFDIDWSHLKEDILDSTAFKDINVQCVSYRVVVDNEDFVHPGVSNRVLNVAFTRWFDAERLTPSGLEAMLVYGAHPTFRWTMKGYNTYTAFKIQIRTKDNKVVYESPMTRVPVLDKDGYYVWAAPFSVGDQTPQGQVLSRAGNYKWTVSMYNAKYQSDLYVSPVDFVTSVNQQQEVDDNGFGVVKVAVKYAGPVEVLKDADNLAKVAPTIRLQAFTTPDFSGVPASQTFVTNVVSITNTLDNTANATLYGLPAGEYYIRAYIDSNGNFVKDDFESWGQAKTAVVLEANKSAPIAGLYIEDADTDQDWIPDAWEYFKYHTLTHDNAKITEGGEIILKSVTYNALTGGAEIGPNFSRFLTGASLTFFENADAAKALIPDLKIDTVSDTIAAIRDAIEKKVQAGTVRISSLVVDAANNKILLTIDGEVADNIAGMLLTPIYELATPTTVKISIYQKSSLLVTDWSWVDDVTVEITNKLKKTVEVKLPAGVDFNSGFYKVEVIQ